MDDEPKKDPATQILDVFKPREGEPGDVWSQGYGSLSIPKGWEFLERGDPFVTRHVKTGPHWILKGRYNKKSGYTPVKGVYAPAESIVLAKDKAVA